MHCRSHDMGGDSNSVNMNARTTVSTFRLDKARGDGGGIRAFVNAGKARRRAHRSQASGVTR